MEKRIDGRRKTKLFVGRLRTRGSAGERREEKEELLVCPCGVSPEGSGETVQKKGAMTKKIIHRYCKVMGSRSRSSSMLGNPEQITEGPELGI
jgi:hypothetical protein